MCLLFIRYFLYLHFKYYPLSWFPLWKPPIPSLLLLLTSPPIDESLRHPHIHLHMQLEPWVPPCVFIGWWFSPRELWRYWLVHIDVPSMGLQSSSAPWVFLWLWCLSTEEWIQNIYIYSIEYYSVIKTMISLNSQASGYL